MSRADFPEPIKELILCLKQLPGVGPRSAERVALWIYREGTGFSELLADTLHQVQTKVSTCPICGFFSQENGCALCNDTLREASETLCVVEQAVDVLALEKTGAFQGRYHVLGGKLSPLRHIGPEDLALPQLEHRLVDQGITEVILALSNDVEGEATSNYITDMLRDTDVMITRLAQGLPAGGGLDHADELTLLRALSGRTQLKER